jgi:hypothetical protein
MLIVCVCVFIAIHVLMTHNQVKFVISDNPFTNSKTSLAATHPFEVLKKHIYVRNDPATAVRESRSSALAPYVMRTIPVHFSNVEWAFYQDESRRVTSSNLFSEQYANLRQLCCHPASGWMSRLSDESNHKEFSVLSLDQLRARMVKWKKDDVDDIYREIGEHFSLSCVYYYMHYCGLRT